MYYESGLPITAPLQNLIFPEQPTNDDFLDTMKRIFFWSKILGVAGPRKTKSDYLWRIYGAIIFSLLLAIQIGAVYKLVKLLAGLTIESTGNRSFTARLSGAAFYTSSFLAFILIWRLSFNWEKLSAEWSTVEKKSNTTVSPDKTLKRRLITLIVVMACLSTCEHIMSVLSEVDFDAPASDFLKSYILNSHAFILLPSDYSIWLALPILLISNIATVLWNYQDLIIVVISMGLSSRYKRLTASVQKTILIDKADSKWSKNTEVIRVYAWRKIREAYVKQAALVRSVDTALGGLIMLSSSGNFYYICLQLFLGITKIREAYVKQSALVRSVDNALGGVIMLSSSGNFYYICLQLFLGITKIREAYVKQAALVRSVDNALGGVIMLSSSGNFYYICLQLFLEITQGVSGAVFKRIYYLVSLTWLIIRFTCVVLAAADVNVHSKAALRFLHGCTEKCYNIEIERLQKQLTKDYVALSGVGFFYLDRSILLQMAAAIITYELVLIQLDGKNGIDNVALNETKT